jgi:glycerol-3-phosphate dehydrogenase (NAD(P)+)
MTKQRVLIVGYGEMGHAMQHLLQSRHAITVWHCDTPEGMAVPLVQAAAEKDFIILCIPTGPLHDIAVELKPSLQAKTLVISISKGLDDQGRIAFDAVSEALEPSTPRAVIYGPMISEELRADRPGFAQVGSPDPEWAQRIQSLFEDSGLYLTSTADTTGISWCAVLKNIYAMAFGMADELELGDNVRGYLATVTMRELAAISRQKGGTEAAPYGLAGLGDLLTTATSIDSHHHALGMQLARGERDNLAGEGTHTIKLISKLKLIDTHHYPLMRLIQEIVLTDCDVREKWRHYLDGTFRLMERHS